MIGLLLLTGKPDRLLPRGLWPLHQAIIDAASTLEIDGMALAIHADGNVGLAVDGVPAALLQLCRSGALTYVDRGVDSHYLVNRDQLGPYLRDLMALTPATADQIYGLGKRFSTSCARVWKNWLKLRRGSIGSSGWSTNDGSLRHGPAVVSC
jgi:hypothetical protein